MMTVRKLEDLIVLFTSWVASYEREKAKFLERLDTRPSHALEWSVGMFSLAPKFEIASYYLKEFEERKAAIESGEEAISEEEALRNVFEVAYERTISAASNSPKRSSSSEANAIHAYEGAAWAEIAGAFRLTELVSRKVA